MLLMVFPPMDLPFIYPTLSLLLLVQENGPVLSVGAIVGIVIGVLVVVALVAALGCFIFLARIRRYNGISQMLLLSHRLTPGQEGHPVL